MITSRTLRATALLALVGSTPLFGAAYVGSAYEGFNYTAGTSIDGTFTGGTGWNAAGDASANTAWATGTNLTASGTRTISATGLTYGGDYPAGTGNSVQVTGAGQVGRSLGQTVDAGTFYFSYLTQKTVDQLRTVNLAFFSSSGTGTAERLAIGQFAANGNTRDQDGNWLAGAGANAGNFSALISGSQNNTAAANTAGPAANGAYVNTTSPVSYALNSTFLIVGKLEFNFAGGATVEDRLTLYINPGNLGDESSLIPYLTIDHNDFGALTGFRLFAGGSGGGFTAAGALFDEIRLGSTYNAVTGVSPIPEPSTLAALAGLAGLALAASRRRRDRD